VENHDRNHIVFVGLGNPGTKYEMTRHNLGAIVVQGFAHAYHASLKEDKRFLAHVGKKLLWGITVHLVLPTTYMNDSGNAVRKYLDYLKLSPQDIVICNDDADLSFGELRLRPQGTSGGHNGLNSIQQALGTIQYPRLRMGIGREGAFSNRLADFVLERFTKQEAERLPIVVDAGIQALKLLATEPIETVMNIVNVAKKQANQPLKGEN